MKFFRFYITPLIVGILFLLSGGLVYAQSFSVSPAKIELSLGPGESITQNILIKNDLGKSARFFVDVEDFVGSKSTDSAVELLEEGNSPYSLKRYITTGTQDFILRSGESRSLLVSISLPSDVPPGGRYAAVLVSTETVGTGPITPTVRTRIGSLFFVKIDGPVKESGNLTNFGLLGGSFKIAKPGRFFVGYENDGNVYLSPYGIIEIKNIFNQKVGEQIIDPWFVMPGSERVRDMEQVNLPGWGIYKAELSLNRGYKDIIDKDNYYFVSIGLPASVLILLIFLLVVWGIIKLRKFYGKK